MLSCEKYEFLIFYSPQSGVALNAYSSSEEKKASPRGPYPCWRCDHRADIYFNPNRFALNAEERGPLDFFLSGGKYGRVDVGVSD